MSHVQAAVLCDEGASSSTPSVMTFRLLKEQGKKKEDTEDEKKYHGAVDESLSEQQFCKSDAITSVV